MNSDINKQLRNYLPKWWHWLIGVLIVLVSFKYIHGISEHAYWKLPRPSLYYGIIVPFLLCVCDKKIVRGSNIFRIPAIILAFVFSQFIIVGEEYYTFHDWSLCFDIPISKLLWLFQSCCYGFVFYRMLLAAYHFIEQNNELESSGKLNLRKWFWIIILTRLVFFIAFYPCIFDFDAALGLRTFLDFDTPTCNHNPVFVQALQALFFTIGAKIGHRSVGMALLSLIYIITSSLLLIYGGKLINDAKVRIKWKRIFMGLYTFCPLFPFLSIFLTKDGFFAYSFLFYILTLYEIYISGAACIVNKRFIFFHIVSVLFVCLTRHQGIYLVLGEMIVLLLSYRNRFSRILPVITLPVILYFLIDQVVLPYYDVEPGGKQEKYGMLFQHTAYYLKVHPEDVTTEEISQINQVLESDKLSEKYSDLKTDPVKLGYRFNPTYKDQYRHINREGEGKALAEYMKAWLSMGLRHPLTYLKSSATIFLGFFYNDELPLVSPYTRWATNRHATRPEYVFWHVDRVAEYYIVREYGWVLLPVINIVLGIPYYNWLAIFILTVLAYRREWRKFFTFFPILLSLGVLFICPIVDGRYVYPLVTCLPLMLITMLNKEQEDRLIKSLTADEKDCCADPLLQ